MTPEVIQLDRYRIVGQWTGSGAPVWVARSSMDATDRRVYAIQTLPCGADPAKLCDRLRTTAHALSLLDDPRFEKTRDVIAHEGSVSVVTDFPLAEPLSLFIDTLSSSSSRTLAATIMRDAARSLARAHAAKGSMGIPLNLIHGDVCPSNIAFSLESGELLIRNFGHSLLLSQPARPRVASTPVGELGYMAPERVSSNANLDARADLYSVGLILWEMLTGIRAIRGTPSELSSQATRVRIPAPTVAGAKCGSVLDGIVMRALAIDKGERYETIANFADDLDTYLRSRTSKNMVAAEMKKLANQHFAHKARAMQTLIERWSSLTPIAPSGLRKRPHSATPEPAQRAFLDPALLREHPAAPISLDRRPQSSSRGNVKEESGRTDDLAAAAPTADLPNVEAQSRLRRSAMLLVALTLVASPILLRGINGVPVMDWASVGDAWSRLIHRATAPETGSDAQSVLRRLVRPKRPVEDAQIEATCSPLPCDLYIDARWVGLTPQRVRVKPGTEIITELRRGVTVVETKRFSVDEGAVIVVDHADPIPNISND